MSNEKQEARTAIYTMRDLSFERYRGNAYEFEDIIAELERVSFARLGFKPDGFSLRTLVPNRVETAAPWIRRFIGSNLRINRDSGQSDLFFAYFCTPDDIVTLTSLPDWDRKSGVKICWLQELWVRAIESGKYDWRMLNRFDHVICSMQQSAERLTEILDVPVTYLPWGVDTLAASPWPNPPERVIDFNNISNVSAVTHDALKRMMADRGMFYQFETLTGRLNFASGAEHRFRFREYIKRSRYFFVPLAKQDNPERGAQVEFGVRFLEGASGGAVLLGARPDTRAYREHLDWEDCVIEIPHECAHIADIIDELDRQPERLERIARRNVVECLRRHDYVYRWEEVLSIAGLPSGPEVAQRREAIENLARQIEGSAPEEQKQFLASA